MNRIWNFWVGTLGEWEQKLFENAVMGMIPNRWSLGSRRAFLLSLPLSLPLLFLMWAAVYIAHSVFCIIWIAVIIALGLFGIVIVWPLAELGKLWKP